MTSVRAGSPAPAAAGTRAGLGDAFMLRVAGLPVEAVRPLRCPAAADWAAEVLAETERLAAAGAALSEPLGALVTAAGRRRPPAAAGGAPAGLRQHRAPRPGGGARPGRRPARPMGTALTGWLADRRRLDERVAAGAGLVAAELDRTRSELRALVAGEDRLRAGLLLASPTLDGQLDAYLAGPGSGTRADKRTRRIERSVLSYLYRTACKTSPFSTFTAVAAGRFGAGGPGPVAARSGVDQPRAAQRGRADAARRAGRWPTRAAAPTCR